MSGIFGIKFSDSYEAKRSRVRRLPQLLMHELEAQALKDAEELVSLFKQGIRRHEYPLKALKPETIERKTRAGYASPSTPLFGTSRRKNRYNNMLEIVKIGRRWIVRPRKEKHWHASIGLDVMFDVHEYGATINGKARDGSTVRIRIPPRPAFRLAYNRFLRERLQKDPSAQMQKKVIEYINRGNWRAQKRQQRKNIE